MSKSTWIQGVQEHFSANLTLKHLCPSSRVSVLHEQPLWVLLRQLLQDAERERDQQHDFRDLRQHVRDVVRRRGLRVAFHVLADRAKYHLLVERQAVVLLALERVVEHKLARELQLWEEQRELRAQHDRQHHEHDGHVKRRELRSAGELHDPETTAERELDRVQRREDRSAHVKAQMPRQERRFELDPRLEERNAEHEAQPEQRQERARGVLREHTTAREQRKRDANSAVDAAQRQQFSRDHGF